MGILTDGRAVVPCAGSKVDHCRAVPTTGLFGSHSFWARFLNSLVIVNSRKFVHLPGRMVVFVLPHTSTSLRGLWASGVV
jgi:hypothetical protein